MPLYACLPGQAHDRGANISEPEWPEMDLASEAEDDDPELDALPKDAELSGVLDEAAVLSLEDDLGLMLDEMFGAEELEAQAHSSRIAHEGFLTFQDDEQGPGSKVLRREPMKGAL